MPHHISRGIVVLCIVTFFHLPISKAGISDSKPEAINDPVALHFEPNQGQTAEGVQYQARGRDYLVLIDGTGARLILPGPTQARLEEDRWQHTRSLSEFRMNLVGANRKAAATGQQPMTSVSHYFKGPAVQQQFLNVPHFKTVRFNSVYPGIDLVYQGQAGNLRYDFVLKPNANPMQIRLHYAGGDRLEITKDGGLLITTENGRLLQPTPAVYQDINDHRIPIAGRFTLRGDNIVGFELADYDADKILVIDPTLDYSSYLGGSDLDSGRDIGLDAAGNIIITGNTQSLDFPTTVGAFDLTYNGLGTSNFKGDISVSKLTPDGSALIFSTYVGGSQGERPQKLALDGAGNILVSGRTSSPDFPVTGGAYQTVYAGGSNPSANEDAFLFKLSADGSSLIFSTYVGAFDVNHPLEELRGVEVDGAGNIWVIGNTGSPNFPADSVIGGGFCVNGDSMVRDAAIVIGKFDALGNKQFLRCFGGEGRDSGRAIHVEPGAVYVAGWTESMAFPTTSGAFQEVFGGVGPGSPLSTDGWVAKLSADASVVNWVSYLGGEELEFIESLLVSPAGQVTVAGQTRSPDFPVVNAIQPAIADPLPPDPFNQLGDALITQFKADGSGAEFSTYLGGSGSDFLWSEGTDGTGRFYLGGFTDSADYPTVNPLQGHGGMDDIALVAISSDGQVLEFSSYLGGSMFDGISNGLITPASGVVMITGTSSSSDYPVVAPYQPFIASPGLGDQVIAKISFELDDDQDGVPNEDDVCPGTEIPEATVPSLFLKKKRYALTDGDLVFDTDTGTDVFNTSDTGGCSCEQIIAATGGGLGLIKYGCPKGTIQDWINAL